MDLSDLTNLAYSSQAQASGSPEASFSHSAEGLGGVEVVENEASDQFEASGHFHLVIAEPPPAAVSPSQPYAKFDVVNAAALIAAHLRIIKMMFKFGTIVRRAAGLARLAKFMLPWARRQRERRQAAIERLVDWWEGEAERYFADPPDRAGAGGAPMAASTVAHKPLQRRVSKGDRALQPLSMSESASSSASSTASSTASGAAARASGAAQAVDRFGARGAARAEEVYPRYRWQWSDLPRRQPLWDVIPYRLPPREIKRRIAKLLYFAFRGLHCLRLSQWKGLHAKWVKAQRKRYEHFDHLYALACLYARAEEEPPPPREAEVILQGSWLRMHARLLQRHGISLGEAHVVQRLRDVFCEYVAHARAEPEFDLDPRAVFLVPAGLDAVFLRLCGSRGIAVTDVDVEEVGRAQKYVKSVMRMYTKDKREAAAFAAAPADALPLAALIRELEDSWAPASPSCVTPVLSPTPPPLERTTSPTNRKYRPRPGAQSPSAWGSEPDGAFLTAVPDGAPPARVGRREGAGDGKAARHGSAPAQLPPVRRLTESTLRRSGRNPSAPPRWAAGAPPPPDGLRGLPFPPGEHPLLLAVSLDGSAHSSSRTGKASAGSSPRRSPGPRGDPPAPAALPPASRYLSPLRLPRPGAGGEPKAGAEPARRSTPGRRGSAGGLVIAMKAGAGRSTSPLDAQPWLRRSRPESPLAPPGLPPSGQGDGAAAPAPATRTLTPPHRTLTPPQRGMPVSPLLKRGGSPPPQPTEDFAPPAPQPDTPCGPVAPKRGLSPSPLPGDRSEGLRPRPSRSPSPVRQTFPCLDRIGPDPLSIPLSIADSARESKSGAS